MTVAVPTPAPMPTSGPAYLASLPHIVPVCVNAHLALFLIRRLGAHGLGDARATQAMLIAFGEHFRRPLILMRAFMADMAHAASQPISIAPCCCPRMTGAEATLITILARAEVAPDTANLLLGDLIGIRRADGVLAAATAVAQAFADAGRPIGVNAL